MTIIALLLIISIFLQLIHLSYFLNSSASRQLPPAPTTIAAPQPPNQFQRLTQRVNTDKVIKGKVLPFRKRR